MSICKQKIFFDKAAATENDVVGSYLIGGTDNTVIGNDGADLLVKFSNTTIAVTATALDIRALTQADEITVFQGTSPWVVSGSVSIVEDVSDGAVKASAAAVSTVAQVLSTPLVGRTSVIIQNLGDKPCYLGHSNAVTALNGLEIPKYSNVEVQADANAALWMIAASGTQDIRFLEIKK